MVALSLYRISSSSVRLEDGSLFGLEPEFKTPAQIEYYRRAALGWSRCPIGYSVYKFACGLEQFAIPGIRVPEDASPKRKIAGHLLRFSRGQVEAVGDELRKLHELVDTESAALVSNLTHDLRALSGQIYNAAEMLKTHMINMAYGAAVSKSDTVIAAQQMLSLRLDMLDYSTGLALEQEPERIPVYKKFDKIVKCFQPNAELLDIRLDIQGPSLGYTYGAPVFELVPFVLVENAVKYAPRKTPITVKVSDFDSYIDAHVQSFGPKIAKAEIPRLFEQGFRGEAARKTGKSGSGVGLFAAWSLLRGSFNGALTVAQDPISINLDGVEVWRTTFSCRVPRSA